jgi:hypothetical protein
MLKLRSTTSQTLQGAPPGCDSPRMPPLASCTPSRIVLHSSARNKPIDRTARPAVDNKTPIESRKPTSVQPWAVKKASLLASIVEVWMVRIVSARCSAEKFSVSHRTVPNECEAIVVSLMLCAYNLTLQVVCARALCSVTRSCHLEIATSPSTRATPSPLILSSRSCSGPSPLDASIDLCGCSPTADASPSSLPPSADNSFNVPSTAPQLLPLCP